jgi:hypothetical protein
MTLKTGRNRAAAPAQAAEIVREYGPFDGAERIHGVTHDGRQVWAATGTRLVAFDPGTGRTTRTLERACDAGTAFDGTHLYQIAEARIDKFDPDDGEVLERLQMPAGTNVSGLESDGADLFYCGGGGTGKVRAVRRPRRMGA